MRFTRLNESDEYRRHREELRVAELDLIDHVERVAALRRDLPADTVVDNYELVDVANGDRVLLSELFSAPDRALVLYHFMYGKAQTEPCPLCTMWIDGYNAAAPHLSPNVDFCGSGSMCFSVIAEGATWGSFVRSGGLGTSIEIRLIRNGLNANVSSKQM